MITLSLPKYLLFTIIQSQLISNFNQTGKIPFAKQHNIMTEVMSHHIHREEVLEVILKILPLTPSKKIRGKQNP